KEETWNYSLQVHDGTDYSIVYYSPSTVILNSAPTISDLEFVNPNNNPYFLVEDVLLNLTYDFADVDEMDNDASIIFWYRNGIPFVRYTNRTTIPSNETAPGDVWNVTVIPYDGFDQGSKMLSIEIIIESRPEIFDYGIDIKTSEEGFYNFWINTSDKRNEIERVEYYITINAINHTFDPILISSYKGTPEIWILENFKVLEKLTDLGYKKEYFIALMNTNLTVYITVVTSVNYAGIDYSIKGYYTFTFVIEDKVPPRVIDADYTWDDDNNPTSITFYSIIEDYGAGVDNVTLHYDFEEAYVTNGGKGTFVLKKYYQDSSFRYKVSMIYNGTHYVVTVPFHPNGTTNILYTLEVVDKLGNINTDAYPDGYDPQNVEKRQYEPPAVVPWESFILIIIALVVVAATVSYIGIKKFSSTELVGLDISKVMETIDMVTDEEIKIALSDHTLGIVVSVFDQWHGPIPIFVEPTILRDNFDKMVELSDRSFSASRFIEGFDEEKPSSFEFNLAPGVFTSSLTFGFSLERPEKRGGAENITLNILVNKTYDFLVSQFIEQFSDIVHEIHILMDKNPSEREKIATKVIKLRKMITSIILAYESLYGPVEALEYDEEEENNPL
ncbi:MAG: hypothetical protein ACFFD4_30605, partial [Candidatus Odinarchaeota archaeon]